MERNEALTLLLGGPDGIREWNRRRAAGEDIPNLDGISLSSASEFRDSERPGSRGPNLSGADLRNVNLINSYLCQSDLSGADLRGALLLSANLSETRLDGANLDAADLHWANVSWSSLERVQLRGAKLRRARLDYSNCSGAILTGADLAYSNLTRVNFDHADLTGCRIYGSSIWDVRLEGSIQRDLVITNNDAATVTVDNLEIAQFIYLLISNKRLSSAIETITSKVVLILGRFKPERKLVLNALRDEFRNRDFVPVLFDFEKPDSLDFTETITLLARMARFIVADVTEPSSIPQELQAIVPDVAVPVLPILQGAEPYSMFKDYRKYDWVLAVQRYEDVNDLLQFLQEKVIGPVDAKRVELLRRKSSE